MFGEKVYYYRKQMGLSQKELAALLNVTNKAISKWETGAALPKSELIIKLAEIFNVSADELLNLVSETREEKAPQISTLKELCEQTTKFLQKESYIADEKKFRYEFGVGTAKFYIITIGLISLLCIMGLLFIAIYFWDMLGETFSVDFWIIFELFGAFVFSGFYTGLFCYIYFFKTFPTSLKAASLFLFPITFVVLFYGGIILFIPTVIKSTKLIVKNRGANKNE